MTDLPEYTHRIFVDFSGDDGDPSKHGASKVICIAWVLSSEADLTHNKTVILKIKKLIGCKPKDELKYSTLSRHQKKRQALTLLSELKISVVVVPVIKEYIKEAEFQRYLLGVHILIAIECQTVHYHPPR